MVTYTYFTRSKHQPKHRQIHLKKTQKYQTNINPKHTNLKQPTKTHLEKDEKGGQSLLQKKHLAGYSMR
jgi:hypothetical protein